MGEFYFFDLNENLSMFMALSALTRRVNKMIVKDVYKLAYKQVLVAFGSRSSASKALKGFIFVYFLF